MISLAFVQTVVPVVAVEKLSSPVAKLGIAVSTLHMAAQRAAFMRLWEKECVFFLNIETSCVQKYYINRQK